MLKDCKFEIWNWKYNKFTPVEILEKVGKNFIRIIGYDFKVNKDTGERIETKQYRTMTYLEGLRRIDGGEFNLLSMFPENTMIKTCGYEIIVDWARFDLNGNIRVFYKYIQCDESKAQEIRDKFPAWSWINLAYNAQFKKVNYGYNFITIRPEDNVEFSAFLPSRLIPGDIRKKWYFEDAVDYKTIVYMERLLGFIRDDGLTWMEYLSDNLDRPVAIKIKDSDIICTDMKDPKNPVQICKLIWVEETIEEVVRYIRNKKKEES